MHSSCAAWQMLFPLHQNIHYAGEHSAMPANWIPVPGLFFMIFQALLGCYKSWWEQTSKLEKINLPVEVGERWDRVWLSQMCHFFFLASETRCVDSKGAGVLGEDDWPWISQLEWHWLGHSHQVHRGDTSQMWKISGPASFLVLPLKGGICKLECGQFCPQQPWAC